MRLFAALLLAALSFTACAEELRWVGVEGNEINDKGKTVYYYAAGQASADDLDRLRSGALAAGFLRLVNVLWIDSEKGEYRMNSEGSDSREESDEVLFRAGRIDRVIVLKADPRTLYRRQGEAAPGSM